MKRVESLDYLRGLMALSVMVYHYSMWSGVVMQADSILGRLGVYAVSGFYVLSGISLAMVYSGRLTVPRDALAFWIRRLFRIAPLFWLATLGTLWLDPSAASRLWVNISLAFGFVRPNGYIATGAWSIGNEIVFYALFPALLLVRRAVPVALVASLVCAALYAFLWLPLPDRSLGEMWGAYIDPKNQLFLFMAGVVIGRTQCGVGRWGWLLIAGVAAFAFWPATGDALALVTGWTRFVMAGSVIAIILAFYRANPVVHTRAAMVLAFFGQGCYSIYLLHPLVYNALPKHGATWALAAPLTLLASWITYRLLEKPMMDLGARLARKVMSTHEMLDKAAGPERQGTAAAGVLRPLD